MAETVNPPPKLNWLIPALTQYKVHPGTFNLKHPLLGVHPIPNPFAYYYDAVMILKLLLYDEL